MKEYLRHYILAMCGLLLLSCTLTSCKEFLGLPKASGRPYEVLVVMENDQWEGPAGRALFKLLDADVPGLPQPEPAFQISHTDKAHYGKVLNVFRNIIIVDVNPSIYTRTSLKFVRDLNALDQIVMTIQSPSLADFKTYCETNGEVITDFFTKMEMNRLIHDLQEKYSVRVANVAKELFDCEFHAPEEIQKYKKGQDFFWASSDGASGLVNVCMYSYPYEGPETFNKEYVLHKRDSVMAVNIPGTLPSMHMATDTMCTMVKPIVVHNEYAMEARGLWYMENDGMGGPFVSHSRVDITRNLVIVVEGFVFAPEKQKRGLMRRLEGSLYTLNLPNEEMSDIVTTLDELVVTE